MALHPNGLQEGKAVSIRAGISDEKQIELVLHAGLAAAQAEDLNESMRFVSEDYADPWGFNAIVLGRLIERAYKEFGGPLIELRGRPVIDVNNARALVFAEIRGTAVYRGRRNYLLGDEKTYNNAVFRFVKTERGWKLASIRGLKPLGFDEQFFRLLGAEVGLQLSEAELKAKKQNCMPCRNRMAELFQVPR